MNQLESVPFFFGRDPREKLWPQKLTKPQVERERDHQVPTKRNENPPLTKNELPRGKQMFWKREKEREFKEKKENRLLWFVPNAGFVVG